MTCFGVGSVHEKAECCAGDRLAVLVGAHAAAKDGAAIDRGTGSIVAGVEYPIVFEVEVPSAGKEVIEENSIIVV